MGLKISTWYQQALLLTAQNNACGAPVLCSQLRPTLAGSCPPLGLDVRLYCASKEYCLQVNRVGRTHICPIPTKAHSGNDQRVAVTEERHHPQHTTDQRSLCCLRNFAAPPLRALADCATLQPAIRTNSRSVCVEDVVFDAALRKDHIVFARSAFFMFSPIHMLAFAAGVKGTRLLLLSKEQL